MEGISPASLALCEPKLELVSAFVSATEHEARANSPARAHPAVAKVGAWCVAGGWLLIGLSKLVLVNTFGAAPHRLSTRLLHHGVELGRHVGLGMAFGVVAYVWLRVGPRSRRLRACAVTVLALVLGTLFLSSDLSGLAERTADVVGLSPPRLLASLVLGVALVLAALVEFALHARLGYWPLLPLGAAVVLQYLDSTVSPMANSGAHFFLSWMSAVCVAPCLGPLAARWAGSPWVNGRWVRFAVWPVVGLWFFWSVAAPQRHSVQIDIARWPANLMGMRLNLPFAVTPSRAGRTDVTNPFFADRSRLPHLPPSARRLLPADAIVVVISIDSLRADVFGSAEQAAYMPTVSRLRAAGVSFEAARAPGSQTVVALAGISTGTYFSQQYWTREPDDYEYWLAHDKSRHFATDLVQAGVNALALPAAHWMQADWGLLRGFHRNEFDESLARWSTGEEVTQRLLEALDSHRAGPTLLFAHYLDSHAPFVRGGEHGSPKELYLRSLGFVDQQVAQLVATVEAQGARQRTLFIITGDHGEAFGEHNMYFHGNTLYDELLRVPLIVSGAQLAPARIHTPVSLVDLGPTLLDLHGLPTPASFMGQSLVPLLEGRAMVFERPIVAEGLLRQAMVFDDGYKVIRNQREQSVELYNLSVDPGENHNLSDDVDLSVEEHLLALDFFFEVHTQRSHGYRPPLRK